ncbi:MAG TPA: tRNA (adenosine(37)-N6)-threonylcarbamoyltransferase complex dimerization subunit type 1 TsaB [Burkholderiaceae bacterium]|nr:tRNA (adenosine(37)-N6)-threonylcarbamoyltransferase complex dimerization subunit type 1 TsaB [Burkholderiaceae bacterium]
MNSPRILAIDTATDVCSVALLHEGAVTLRSEVVGQRHSERALPMVDAVLQAAGVGLRDLDFVAFGAGPGSFTGLRIACGVAQGLAWGAGKCVIGVGNLRAMADRVFRDESCGRVLCAIDARMHEAYSAIYAHGRTVEELRPPALARPSDLAAMAESVDAIAGDALTVFPDAWKDLRGPKTFPALRADAGDIVRVAALPEFIELAVPPHLAAPLYVRDQVAATIEQRRAQASVP